MATQTVSRREAADALGIKRQRLERLIKEGRIVEESHGRIDLAKARAAYEATIDPAKRAAYESTAPGAAKRVRSGPVSVVDTSTGKPVDFATARTQKELANARRAELDYAIKSGAYLPRDEVSAKEFAIARKLRDRILGFPARLANLVPPEAMSTIVDECEALVRELQDDVATIAESGAV